MRERDIFIKEGGKDVQCRVQAADVAAACELYKYADENHPLGYVLLSATIARRKKGGRVRFVLLSYFHTGNVKHAPEADWRAWVNILEAEQRVGRGLSPEEGVLSQTA